MRHGWADDDTIRRGYDGKTLLGRDFLLGIALALLLVAPIGIATVIEKTQDLRLLAVYVLAMRHRFSAAAHLAVARTRHPMDRARVCSNSTPTSGCITNVNCRASNANRNRVWADLSCGDFVGHGLAGCAAQRPMS
jgi:hypothetical protein